MGETLTVELVNVESFSTYHALKVSEADFDGEKVAFGVIKAG